MCLYFCYHGSSPFSWNDFSFPQMCKLKTPSPLTVRHKELPSTDFTAIHYKINRQQQIYGFTVKLIKKKL